MRTCLGIALILAAVPAFSGIKLQEIRLHESETNGRAEVGAIRLLSGDVVRGSFQVEPNGVFHFHDSGGKLYRWHLIEPESLSDELQTSLRARVLRLLSMADRHYHSSRITQAQRIYKQVWRGRHYLTSEDIDLPTFENIYEKMQGLVVHQDQWVSFASLQKLRGLAYYKGQWRPEAQVDELRAFRTALTFSRGIGSIDEKLLCLHDVEGRYPNSRFVRITSARIDALKKEMERGLENQRERAEALRIAALIREQRQALRPLVVREEHRPPAHRVVVVHNAHRKHAAVMATRERAVHRLPERASRTISYGDHFKRRQHTVVDYGRATTTHTPRGISGMTSTGVASEHYPRTVLTVSTLTNPLVSQPFFSR